MLERVDRVQLVVKDRQAAARTFGDLLGARAVREEPSGLSARGARFTPRGSDPKAERDGLWVHPSALCGLLLGISRTTVGWEWSGQPARVARA